MLMKSQPLPLCIIKYVLVDVLQYRHILQFIHTHITTPGIHHQISPIQSMLMLPIHLHPQYVFSLKILHNVRRTIYINTHLRIDRAP